MSAASSPATGRNNKKWLALAAVLALVLIAALVWWLRPPAGEAPAANTSATEPKPVMTVTVAEPKREMLAIALQANGNVSAWQEASVGAEVNGLRLASVNVNVGDAVKKARCSPPSPPTPRAPTACKARPAWCRPKPAI